MPELPDVEVFRKYMDKTALHQTIKEIKVSAKDILDGVSEKQLQSKVKGRQIESTKRHGKYLFTRLSGDDWAVFHFGMTGYLDYFKDEGDAPKHTRALFSFDNGYHLAFVLQRKLGEVALTDDVNGFVKKQGLGPDALDRKFDVQAFKEAVKQRKSSIKSALMDQKRIAGIGNIYSDEILFQARLHPKAKANQLLNRDLERLFKAMKEVLETAIDSQANPAKMPEHYLLPKREKGGKCPACGGEIAKTKVSGRSAYFCPKCQSY